MNDDDDDQIAGPWAHMLAGTLLGIVIVLAVFACLKHLGHLLFI